MHIMLPGKKSCQMAITTIIFIPKKDIDVRNLNMIFSSLAYPPTRIF